MKLNAVTTHRLLATLAVCVALLLLVTAPLRAQGSSVPITFRWQYNFTANATFCGGTAQPATVVVTFTGTVSPSPLTSGFSGTAYGSGNYSYTVSDCLGTVPDQSTGDVTYKVASNDGGNHILSLTIDTGFAFEWTVQLNNGALTGKTISYASCSKIQFAVPNSCSEGFSGTLGNPALQITAPASLPPGAVGKVYAAVQFQAANGRTAYTWSVSEGKLPANMQFSTSGLLTGTPQIEGQFFFTVEVRDAAGATASRIYQLNTIPGSACTPLSIIAPTRSSPGLGTIPPGVDHTFIFTAQCGTPPYFWSLNAVPTGMSLRNCTGTSPSCTLAGSPFGPNAPASDLYFSKLTVTDSSNPPQQDSLTVSLEVRGPLSVPPLTALNRGPQTAYTGKLYIFNFNDLISGGLGPYSWTLSPNQQLPPGLSFNNPGGVGTLVGVPIVPGAYTITATVSDQNNKTATVTLFLTVKAPQTSSSGQTPSISPGGVVDVSGGQPVLTPGGVTSIYGQNLADSTYLSAATPLPTSLGNVQVSVNGEDTPVFYASPTQINFQAPSTPSTYQAPNDKTAFDSQRQTADAPEATPFATAPAANVVVYRNGVPSTSVTVPVSAAMPSVSRYYRTPTVIDPVILHSATNTLVTPQAPASPGEVLVAYGTGIGATTCYQASGAASGSGCLPKAPVPFTFPDYPGLELGVTILFEGLTPQGVGLAQYNVKLPSALPAGAMSKGVLRVRVGDPTSGQTFNLSVANTLARPTPMIMTAEKMVSALGVDSSGNPSLCADPTTRSAFKTTDATARVWYTFTGGQIGDVIQVQWIDPAGAVQASSMSTLTFSGSGCGSGTISVSGTRSASTPGGWTVQLLVNGGWMFGLPFSITP